MLRSSTKDTRSSTAEIARVGGNYAVQGNLRSMILVPIEIIIIIIIERKDLGGVMSKDCKDTLQTLKTVTKREIPYATS